MEKLAISAQLRERKKRRVNKLRNEGYIPGIVYGHKKENKNIKVGNLEFRKVLRSAGKSTLIDLDIDGKGIGKVIISDYQTDPATDKIIHFDLYQVKMNEKMIATVPVMFIGESPSVKNDGGILVKSHSVFEIKCLPGDLIHDIVVDISKLEKIDDIIRVKDLVISDKIEILANPEVVVITVAPPRSEKEIEGLEEQIIEKVEEVEGVVKKEAEESAEGENNDDDKKKEKEAKKEKDKK
jgi:large subunit ribosomal protein L25